MPARIPTVVGPRRKRRRRSSRPWFVVLAAVAILLGATAFRLFVRPAGAAGAGNRVLLRRSALRRDASIIYPYSVIPGGVYSSGELNRALARDPIAAAHYRSFRTESAVATPVSLERRVY